MLSGPYNLTILSFHVFSILGLILSPQDGYASPREQQSPAVFESIWQVPELYNDTSNGVVQKLSLVGRYHGQYWWAKSDENRDSDWENRRMYIGFNAKLFSNITVELQVSLNDDFAPIYRSLYDAFIKWQQPEGDFSVSVGRLDYVYTGMERSTSSKRIKTIERALVVNQIMPGEVVGTYITDTIGPFSYQTGLFSGSIKDEFTDFSGGFGALIGMQHDAPLLYSEGILYLDYLYNNGNAENNAFKPYEHILSLWHEGQTGPLSVGIDITAATGVGDTSDLLGLTLLPTYDIIDNFFLSNDKLQIAMRYHFATSAKSYGLNFNKRYEQPVTAGSGDRYNSFYLGLNYFLYQQKLKLLAGAEYFTMDNVLDDTGEADADTERVDGWNISTGIRLYF